MSDAKPTNLATNLPTLLEASKATASVASDATAEGTVRGKKRDVAAGMWLCRIARNPRSAPATVRTEI